MNMHAIFLNYMYEEESDENQNGFPGYFFIHLSNMSADFDDDDDNKNKLSLLKPSKVVQILISIYHFHKLPGLEPVV